MSEPGERTTRVLVAVLAGCTLGGCLTALPAATAGHVGCPEEQIHVSEVETFVGIPKSWTSECKGTRYYCKQHSTGKSSEVACVPVPGVEARGGDATSRSHSGGCTYDTQCKGNRICSDGRCLDP